MPTLKSAIAAGLPAFKSNAAAMGRAGRRIARPPGRRCARRRRAFAQAAHRTRQAAAARAGSSAWSIPVRPSSKLSPLAAYGMYEGDIHGAGIITGIGRVSGPRMRHRLQRRHDQGRHLLSDHREEAPAGAGDRAAERLPCIYLVDSGGANLPNQADIFPDRDHFGTPSSSTRRRSPPPASPRSPPSWAPAPRAAPMSPAMSDETIIVKGQGTIFLGGPPAGEGRHRRDRHGGRPRRRRRARPPSPASPTHYANDDTHSPRHRAPHRRRPEHGEAAEHPA